MIAKELVPEMGTSSFAIMKADWKYEVSGGGCDYTCSAGMTASMMTAARWRLEPDHRLNPQPGNWFTVSHATPQISPAATRYPA
jgi:hypothetical protein